MALQPGLECGGHSRGLVLWSGQRREVTRATRPRRLPLLSRVHRAGGWHRTGDEAPNKGTAWRGGWCRGSTPGHPSTARGQELVHPSSSSSITSRWINARRGAERKDPAQPPQGLSFADEAEAGAAHGSPIPPSVPPPQPQAGPRAGSGARRFTSPKPGGLFSPANTLPFYTSPPATVQMLTRA